MNKLARVVAFVREQPWAILPETLAVIQDVIRFRASGGRLADEDIQARIGDRSDRSGGRMQGAVAVLPLHGIIAHRARMVDDISGPGGTSTERFSQGLRSALEDPSVESILIDVDSPGGSAFGVQELAEEIREMKSLRTRVSENVRAAIETHMSLLDGLMAEDHEDPVAEGKISYLTHVPREAKSSGEG